ncbi:hypothetical protein [uncultured Tateyamaria sp.]|uniref:hypothetical protein n=1 Tax=uncultured Tateyamaria sp. TaxID=455651 RepID=UPI00262DB867|nr:hypothetical protein [uncultured Tateyamaria sp.]
MTDPASLLEVYLRVPGPDGRLTSDEALLDVPDFVRDMGLNSVGTGGIVFDDERDSVVVTDDLFSVYQALVIDAPAALKAGETVRYRLRGDPSELVMTPSGDQTVIVLDDDETITISTELLLDKLAQTAERFERLQKMAAGEG